MSTLNKILSEIADKNLNQDLSEPDKCESDFAKILLDDMNRKSKLEVIKIIQDS